MVPASEIIQSHNSTTMAIPTPAAIFTNKTASLLENRLTNLETHEDTVRDQEVHIQLLEQELLKTKFQKKRFSTRSLNNESLMLTAKRELLIEKSAKEEEQRLKEKAQSEAKSAREESARKEGERLASSSAYSSLMTTYLQEVATLKSQYNEVLANLQGEQARHLQTVHYWQQLYHSKLNS